MTSKCTRNCIEDNEESDVPKRKNSTPDSETEKGDEKLICAICLQTCVHPARLPCGHIFCFLCIKGIAFQNRRCAMCRRHIPLEYLEQPELLPKETAEQETVFEDGYQWFYEGWNGWWQYDERTSTELETAYKNGERSCELLIAGFMYVLDFDNMIQVRKQDASRRRRIKRDLATIPKKGIAGIRIHSDTQRADDQTDDAGVASADGSSATNGLAVGGATGTTVGVSSNLRVATGPSGNRRQNNNSPIPIPPTNTPQTPHTPSANSGSSSPSQPHDDSSLRQVMQGINSLRLLETDREELYGDSDSSDARDSSLWTTSELDGDDDDEEC